jgi:hypothetical protein
MRCCRLFFTYTSWWFIILSYQECSVVLVGVSCFSFGSCSIGLINRLLGLVWSGKCMFGGGFNGGYVLVGHFVCM